MSLAACGGNGGGKPQPTLDSISVKENSVPTSFTVDDTFSVEGGILIARYSDNSTSEVGMTLEMIRNKPAMTAPLADYEVFVEYLNKETSYHITITEPPVTVSSIRIKNPEDLKTDYFVNEEFTVAGVKLEVTKSNQTRETIDLEPEYILNPPSMDTAVDDYEVIIEYEGAQTSFHISIQLADTREEVSIGIGYQYNGAPQVDIEDYTQELVFTEGKEYHFRYGCRPAEAYDSLSYQYWTKGDNPEKLDEKPLGVGDYTYKVVLPEGDEDYKPAEQSVDYKIVEPVIRTFVLDKDNVNLENNTQEVGEITVNYKGATATENAVATLTRVAASKPAADDNYIEIATAVLFTEGITVEFDGVNRYVYVYGSFDGENFTLLDTLTRAKQTSDRINNYFFIRLVCASAGEESTVVIKKITFKYEEAAVPGAAAIRSESSDLINYMTHVDPEAGEYWYQEDELFDENLSTKAIKMKNIEAPGIVNIGFTITHYQIRYTKFSFRYKLDQDVSFQGYNDAGQLVSKNDMSFYLRPYIGNQKYGINYKIVTFDKQDEWTKVEFYLGDAVGDDIIDVSQFRFWINRKIVDGFVYVDDFRVEQENRYPVENTIIRAELVEGSVPKTEFNAGEEFTFGGQVRVYFTDYLIDVFDESDERLTVQAPDMTVSGEKEVKVSFNYYGAVKTVSYMITVTGGINPKDYETQPIVAEANDLAKASNFLKESSSASGQEETEKTYGNSTTSLGVKGLNGEDKGFYVVLPEALDTANHVSVKFFMKKNNFKFYIRLTIADYSSSNKIKSADAQSDPNSSKEHYTVTDAGNDWFMYEYTYDVSTVISNGKGVGRVSFRTTGSTFPAADELIFIDGLELNIVD